MRVKKSLAIEQVFVIGLFLVLFVVLVGLISYITQRARMADGEDVERDMKINGSNFIYDKCEEFMDEELGVSKFYELFSYVFGGVCARDADNPYLYRTSFVLNEGILNKVAERGGFLEEARESDVNYVLECAKIKNSRVFVVQNLVIGKNDFLVYANSVGGASVCIDDSFP